MERAILIVLSFLLASAAAGAQTRPAEERRIRALSPQIADALLEGIERSPTLRALVERVERGDVIVMLETKTSLKAQLAGSLLWMGASHPVRYVSVRLKVAATSNTFIAILGHELQHVLEIVETPWVIDAASFERFYRESGRAVRSWDSIWDTEAARTVGDIVLGELLAEEASRSRTIR